MIPSHLFRFGERVVFSFLFRPLWFLSGCLFPARRQLLWVGYYYDDGLLGVGAMEDAGRQKAA